MGRAVVAPHARATAAPAVNICLAAILLSIGTVRHRTDPRAAQAAFAVRVERALFALGARTTGTTAVHIRFVCAGRTIFAPAAPDTAELLTHGENAFLVTADNLEAAVDGIEKLKSDDTLRNRLAEGAKATSESLSWDSRAQKIIQFLQRRHAVKIRS